MREIQKQVKEIKRPFGLFLSGGIDSGFLASIAKPDIVFTCKFPYGKKYDEFKDAKKTVKHLKLKQVVITPTKEDFFKYLPEALKMHKLTSHFSLVPLFMLFKEAKERGITTILSGEGPDEYLGGYASYVFIKQEQDMYNLASLKNYKSALDKYLGDPMYRFAKILNRKPEELKPYWKKYRYLLSKMGYCDLILRGIEEMELDLAKGHGINLLYPYMTEKIENFCFKKVRDDYKISGGITKHIFRKVVQNYIPSSVAWRLNKMGGPVAPVGKWLGEENEFSKEKYLDLQYKIIHENK